MSKPWIHSLSSAKRRGGKPEDYLDIHEMMDSSKGIIADNRHRAITHHAWFISVIIPRVFGETRTNSDGKVYSTRDIAEQHCLEDFGGKFIPSAQDFLEQMPYLGWMHGEGSPPSHAKLAEKKRTYVLAD